MKNEQVEDWQKIYPYWRNPEVVRKEEFARRGEELKAMSKDELINEIRSLDQQIEDIEDEF